MNNAPHISDDDMLLLMDGELNAGSAATIEGHLQTCVSCRQRYERLHTGAAAYEEYREQVLKPALEPPATEWRSIRNRMATVEIPRRRFAIPPAVLWAGAALACGLVAAVLYLQQPAGPGAPELLAKATAAYAPAGSSLLLTTGGHRWSRPAVLPPGDEPVADFQHIRSLFIQASYSWKDPLNPRSFSSWRNHLRERQDQVTLLDDGGQRYYRVRTRTPAGILRTASLTLRADTYHPTAAAFDFQDEDPIELSEQPAETPQMTRQAKPATPMERPKANETIAGPEDELRVFAALAEIGADAEEPIDVKLDAAHHHVLVTGMGMPPARQKEVEKALAELPNTIVRFNSAQPVRSGGGVRANPDTYSADKASVIRQTLEARAGGPRQLQAITDRVLDTSNTLFARAHSLLVLAKEFPPDIESTLPASGSQTLLQLRRRRAVDIEQAVRQLHEALGPLLPEAPLDGQSTGGGAANLFEAARNLDQLVGRLLSGSYTEQEGREMLNRLPVKLSEVEALTRQAMQNTR